MRIVCLITVGAFLLSIAIAESDVPIGTTGQYHHPRHPRPIILEPVIKSKSESSPLDWFFKMVSKAVESPKMTPPPIIGPINLPGMAGQVYIRQLNNHMPWESSHVVIKLVTRDPITGMNIPLDSGQSYNHYEDPSRRLQKSHHYGMNSPSGRSNNIQNNFSSSSSSTNQYSNWQNPYRPHHQNYPNQYSKPPRGSSPNDFRHDDYGKHTHGYSKSNQENYDQRRFPANHYNYNANLHNNNNYNNYHNNNNEQFNPISKPNHDSTEATISSQSSIYRSIGSHGSNEPIYNNNYNDQRYKENPQNDDFYSAKPDSPRTTKIPYPAYTNHPDDHRDTMITNDTENLENQSLKNYRNSGGYRQVIRHDRMINHNHRNNHGSIVQRDRMNIRGTFKPQDSRDFRVSTMTKFNLDDVGGIEVITAPNLKQSWKMPIVNEKNKDSSGKSEDSDLSQGEDSMSMGNGKNLARGESAEHDNNEEIINDNSRISQTRLSSYKIIDRSHRSQRSRNLSLADSNENFGVLDRMDDKKNVSSLEMEKLDNSRDSGRDKERIETSGNKGNDEVVHRVMNLTASNRWRFQEGRQPTRVVKAIYRRRPIGEIVKNSRDTKKSNDTSENENSYESSLEN